MPQLEVNVSLKFCSIYCNYQKIGGVPILAYQKQGKEAKERSEKGGKEYERKKEVRKRKRE